MRHNGRKAVYEVVLAPAAHRVVCCMAMPECAGLTEALRIELSDGPNSGKEIRFGSSVWPDADPGEAEAVYTATPLSFDGYTVIHRALSEAEIKRLEEQLGRPTMSWGFYVIDILPAESAFRRWPRLA